MPTYQDLRNYFQEERILQEIAKTASTIPIVSGVTIDVNPLWCLAYDIEDGLVNISPNIFPYWSHYLEQLRLFHQSPYEMELLPPPFRWWWSRYQGYRRRDLYRQVKLWEEFVESQSSNRGDRLPVTLTIVHRPLRQPQEVQEREDNDVNALRRLIAIVREAGAVVRVDERPPARFTLASGDEIQVGTSVSGTIGGVLVEPVHNIFYGVTWAPVAKNGATVTDGTGSWIGTCVADTGNVALPSTRTCDPLNLSMPNTIPGNGPEVNMLDCALIQLTSAMSRPSIGAIASALSQGQDVELHGSATGTTAHKLGSLCLSYQFNDGKHDYCFRDVIELWPQPRGPFGGTIGQLMTEAPKKGDSGGWVLTNSQPPDWAAMLFATDGKRGFAIRAAWVHAWAEKARQSALTV